MTNKPELTDEKIKRRINDIEDRRSASRDFWGGDYEYPEDIELMALRELQELRRSYLALRGETEDVQAQLYEAENRNEADDTELQERRKADSAEPVSFDELNAAVAEVTGGNQHAWNSGIYKGHQAVPFMNYNSLARIVDKYRAPQPVPVVPDEKTDRDYVTDCHGLPSIEDGGHQRGWNACRAAMLQAGNSPVTPDGLVSCGENCWSCGKYFTYEQHSECDGYCPHCDSPVDLDDEEDEQSKSLPANPTEEMISNAWREALGKCDHETIRRMYVAMFAAAPQQEVQSAFEHGMQRYAGAMQKLSEGDK
ncbi:hypothetical protein [Citrobacter meridianamericanus]|uniref:hypothetical protein n=1 Tax=Citrobacter meridianamericanus TaxID=2894201 RepID=UPI00397E656C